MSQLSSSSSSTSTSSASVCLCSWLQSHHSYPTVIHPLPITQFGELLTNDEAKRVKNQTASITQKHYHHNNNNVETVHNAADKSHTESETKNEITRSSMPFPSPVLRVSPLVLHSRVYIQDEDFSDFSGADSNEETIDQHQSRCLAHFNGTVLSSDTDSLTDYQEAPPISNPDAKSALVEHVATMVESMEKTEKSSEELPAGPERAPVLIDGQLRKNPLDLDDAFVATEAREVLVLRRLQRDSEYERSDSNPENALFSYSLPEWYAYRNYDKCYGARAQLGIISPTQVQQQQANAWLSRLCPVNINAILIPHNTWRILIVYPVGRSSVFEFQSTSGSGFTVTEAIGLLSETMIKLSQQTQINLEAYTKHIQQLKLQDCPCFKQQAQLVLDEQMNINNVYITGIYRPRVGRGWRQPSADAGAVTVVSEYKHECVSYDDKCRQELETHENTVYRLEYVLGQSNNNNEQEQQEAAPTAH